MKIKPTASHPKTNEVIISLITSNIDDTSKLLDFGAGQGYMTQKIGHYLSSKGLALEDRLHACEIDPENYKYDGIVCQKIHENSEIPFSSNTFDLIYSIEVLEHMPRPYDFFNEAFDKLKPGGKLIFSTPNISNFKSRMRFLLTGYYEMYGPLSIQEKNAGRLCGHIMPLSYNNYHYGLRKSGFNNIEFHIDRRKRGALIPSIILYPLLKFCSFKENQKLKRYDSEVFSENENVVAFMNSIDALSSRSCIIVATKPM